jgi:cytochrome b6
MTDPFREQWLERLRNNRVWKSVFRRGPARTNRTRSLAIFGNLFLHALPVKAREKSLRVRATYYLGSFAFFLFIVLTVTGILLMLYYHPAAPEAYSDMKDLRFVVSNGVLLRNLHRLAAQTMVLVVFWHMYHVFYRGGYRPPREFNWVVGVVLLLLTLFLSYTGYLLPWDQLAFWAITVGTNIIGYVPFVGHRIRFLLLGGNIIGDSALLRFYVLHCVILPLLAVVFIGVHFWRIQKDGGLSVGESEERKEPLSVEATQVEQETVTVGESDERKEQL